MQTLEEYSFMEGRRSYDGTDLLGEFFESIIGMVLNKQKDNFLLIQI